MDQNYREPEKKKIPPKKLWDAAKEVLRGKFIQSYLKKQEKHWIDNLTLHLKQLEKEELKNKNPKISRRKEIIKIQAEITGKEMKETIVKISSFLFSAILCVVEICPHHVFSQDFQDQAIPGQEAKTESSHSSMDSNENWQ